jgi:hypothetical protein
MKIFSIKNPACWLVLLLSGLTTIVVGFISVCIRNGIGLFEFRIQSLTWLEWSMYAISSLVFWATLYILFAFPICFKPACFHDQPARRAVWGGILWIGILGLFLADLFILEALMGYPVYGFLIRTYLRPDILRKNEFAYINYDSTPNETKCKFYSTYKSGKGTYGIREDTFCEFDGVPFTVYYLTDNGYITRWMLDTPPLLFQVPEYSIIEPNQVEPILGYRDENGKFIRCTPEQSSRDLQLGFKKVKTEEAKP